MKKCIINNSLEARKFDEKNEKFQKNYKMFQKKPPLRNLCWKDKIITIFFELVILSYTGLKVKARLFRYNRTLNN